MQYNTLYSADDKGRRLKEIDMAHGKSASHDNPYGVRGKSFGMVLAPKSLRKKGNKYAANYPDSSIASALGFEASMMDRATEEGRAFIRSIGL
jgi:hypothetical protein